MVLFKLPQKGILNKKIFNKFNVEFWLLYVVFQNRGVDAGDSSKEKVYSFFSVVINEQLE